MSAKNKFLLLLLIFVPIALAAEWLKLFLIFGCDSRDIFPPKF